MSLASILWFIVALVVVVWLIGNIFSFAGSLIHFLLVIAVVIVVYQLFQMTRGTRL